MTSFLILTYTTVFFAATNHSKCSLAACDCVNPIQVQHSADLELPIRRIYLLIFFGILNLKLSVRACDDLHARVIVKYYCSHDANGPHYGEKRHSLAQSINESLLYEDLSTLNKTETCTNVSLSVNSKSDITLNSMYGKGTRNAVRKDSVGLPRPIECALSIASPSYVGKTFHPQAKAR
jgi:hypothetical protein